MKVIVTICSKSKNDSAGEIPAYLRYTSPRINKALEIACKENEPYFILSGKFGLIKYNEPIPFYDHLLTKSEINNLVNLVSKQISDNGIDVVDFYAEPRQGDWVAYYMVLEQAVDITETTINVYPIN